MGLILNTSTIIRNLSIGPLSGGGEGGGGGGSFVTDSLIAHYDIGDTNSYSGTGNILDLTGNGYTASPVSTGTYSSSGTSSFLSGGMYATSYTSNWYNDLTTSGVFNFSVSGWYRFPTTSSGDSDYYLWMFLSWQNDFNLQYLTPTSGDKIRNVMTTSTGATELAIENFSSTYSVDNLWGNFALTVGSSSRTLYLNGSPIQTLPFTGNAPFNSNQQMSVRITSSGDSDLDFAQFAVYGKTLSSSEVLSNYNALKSRYGY